ncbi:MFS transporter [Actinomadura sp. 6K520]|uniref:MFS transporter n=1 Tax=Actinomadura sp. 6K520 TaxID=2530364 RepID=UPI001053690E|nr:MFS transporter [Actinomadura sp. 6K520]TDE36778.1 MFS transporter [Actinomadura sp. 6K520]
MTKDYSDGRRGVNLLPKRRTPRSPDDHAPYGWKPLAVVAAAGFIDRFEHQLLPGVLPFIQDEWGFSDTAAGLLPLGGALAAITLTPLAGYLTDRYRRTRILTVIVLCWAVATLASSLATGFGMFFVIRLLLASSEGFYGPLSGSLLADFYAPRSRAKVYGWRGLTPYLAGVGVVVGGVLAHHFGWRAAFVIAAVPGLIVAAFCARLPEPPRGLLDRMTGTPPDPLGTIARDDDPGPVPEAPSDVAPSRRRAHPKFRRQLRQVMATPTIALLSAGLAALAFGLSGISYWTPTLIHRDHGVSEGLAASVSGAVTVVGVVAGVLAGTRLGRHWGDRHSGGRLLAGGSGIVAGGAILVAAISMPSLWAFAALLLLSKAAMAMAIPNLTASIADVLDATSRGLGFAMVHVFGAFGVAFGPFVVGAVSDATGSMVTAMYALAVPLLLGGLLTIAARLSFESDRDRALAR